MGKLASEIYDTHPFQSLEEELFLNLERTASMLRHPIDEILKPHAISRTQYNVLRILRGAVPNGLACGEIAERLVTRDSDVTRLLDRLERQGLMRRHRAERDRRVVVSRISESGIELLGKLDAPMARVLKRLLGHLSQREARTLVNLLEKARASLLAADGGRTVPSTR